MRMHWIDAQERACSLRAAIADRAASDRAHLQSAIRRIGLDAYRAQVAAWEEAHRPLVETRDRLGKAAQTASPSPVPSLLTPERRAFGVAFWAVEEHEKLHPDVVLTQEESERYRQLTAWMVQ